ncbi:MAG TPA: nuclear transport factor 2 family protein [Steroidobacteraceae bacterium]|nr:nuclear transport factor 2 family protein [Steroidobacteraceae bacterium]
MRKVSIVARASPLTIRDRMAIQELLARYAWALDTGDVEGFLACFTPDAVVIEEVFEEPDRWEGHANLRRLAEHYRSVPDFPGRQHHVSQILMQGDTRRCAVRSFTFVTECRGEPPYLLRFAGYYEDRTVKSGAEWLFKERVIRLWDGPVLARFPGRDGSRTPRKRPPQLIVRR